MKTLLFLMLGFALIPAAHAAPVCDPMYFGAKRDGKTKDTAAIQAAIDSCAKSGGQVKLMGGTFLSGMITLRSGTHFTVDGGATLKGTQDDADYPTQNPPTDNSQLNNCRKSLIYAEGAKNLVLDGTGVIDGNGNTPKWIGPPTVHPERTRPMAIFIVQSDQVTIENLHVKDAAMWAVVNFETDHLTIRGLQVNTPLSGTRDGIDIVDGHHVVIENVDVYSEDDSICLKSGTARGVVDVVVRDSHVRRSIVANALKLGTASTGKFQDVTFENIVIDAADKAAMAVESVDGAAINHLTFRGIQFKNAGTGFFVILGKRGTPKAVGSIEDVTFDNIQGEQMKHSWGSAISGTAIGPEVYEPKNISFNNVHVVYAGGLNVVPSDPPEYAGQYPDPNLWGNLPGAGLYIRHAENVTLKDSSIDLSTRDSRPAIVRR